MLVECMVRVCFEIGLEAPSFPETERVSWPLQTPTPNYSIYLRGEGDYITGSICPSGEGWVTGLFNTIVLETELQVQASTASLGFKCYFKQRDDFLFFFRSAGVITMP